MMILPTPILRNHGNRLVLPFNNKRDREMQNEKYLLIETSIVVWMGNKNTVKFANYHRLLLLINPGTWKSYWRRTPKTVWNNFPQNNCYYGVWATENEILCIFPIESNHYTIGHKKQPPDSPQPTCIYYKWNPPWLFLKLQQKNGWNKYFSI